MNTIIEKLDPIINKFCVFGLFGDRNIKIHFRSPIMILLAENGTGKTTVLNILYELLSGKLLRLGSFHFDYITLEFSSGEEVQIDKKDLLFDSVEISNHPLFQKLTCDIPAKHLRMLLDSLRTSSLESLREDPILRHLARISRRPSSILHRDLIRMIHECGYNESAEEKFENIKQQIKNNVPKEILYFPTYRRIEEDLASLGIGLDIDDERSFQSGSDDLLIQFGMDDVKRRFNRITSEINKSALEWFAKINGEMLSQLINGIDVDDGMIDSIEKSEALEIVLGRVSKSLSSSDKGRISELIKAGALRKSRDKYNGLIYFLSNLIKIYDKQKDLDNSIKAFSSVCKQFLIDKEVDYDESEVTIEIKRKKNGKTINIEKLSSGEKQIMSLFSNLYLDTSEDTVILLDEPELSLSIEWQKKLLPEILNTGKCKFLLAATHSPFIFENYLDKYAKGLDLFIEEK